MKKSKDLSSGVIKSGVRLLGAIPLMGAAASQVNALPTGTAKTISGTAVGLGSVAMVGESMKPLRSFI